MKRFCTIMLTVLMLATISQAAAPKLKFHDAKQLTLVGKLMPGTPNPYHRIDTVKYKGFDKKELLQVRESAGMSIAFKTTSRTIAVKCQYGEVEWPQNSTGIAAHGFDLYIKKDGAWRWAGSGARSQETLDKAQNLVTDMDGTEHECLLYLPLFAEINALEIGVDEGASIEASPIPFRHRIAIFGSSYTHGTSTAVQVSPIQHSWLASLDCNSSASGAAATANSSPTLLKHLPMWKPTPSSSTVSLTQTQKKSRSVSSHSSSASRRHTLANRSSSSKPSHANIAPSTLRATVVKPKRLQWQSK